MTTSKIECSRLRYLPLLWRLWPVRQWWAAVERNDLILTLGSLSKQHIIHALEARNV